MRKTILGSIAAFAAGAASAFGQGPAVPPPAPLGPGGGAMPAPVQAMPYGGPGMGMGGPGMMAGPGMGMGGPGPADPGAVFPDGQPGYPMGTHGQQSWTPPFSDPAGVNNRLAPRAWLEFDYMLGFVKSQDAPFPFVTTSAPLAGGVIGNTSTYVLHNQSGDLGLNVINGARITGGLWTDDARRYGYYMSGFFTEFKTNNFDTSSDSTGQPLLARPFVNAATGNPDVLLVSFPTYLSGRVSVSAGTQLWGAEGGPMVNLYRSCPDDFCLWNLNLVSGFRYLDVHERLEIDQRSTLLDRSLAFDGKLYGVGSQIGVNDKIDTYNRFYGGNLGLNAEMRMNNWYLNATGKVALGVVNQRYDIRGQSTLTGPNSPDLSVIHSGLYANSTNSGRFNQDKFGVVPEVGVNLGYTWRSWLTTSIGYNFLYINSVVRPTNQYSTTINPAVIPLSGSYGANNGVATPNPGGTTSSDFYFHGVNFTITARY